MNRIIKHLKKIKFKLFGQRERKNIGFKNDRVLYVDISEVYHHDHKTGIQRVVRAVLSQLEKKELKNYVVVPIYLTDIDGYWDYRFSDKRYNSLSVFPKEGDVFLGLDLTGRVIHANNAGLFHSWKERNVEFNFVVYDILPLYHPEWWDNNVSDHHLNWFNTIVNLADRLLCISEAVKDDVENYINDNGYIAKPQIDYFHLGADLNSSVPTSGLPSNAQEVIGELKVNPSFLIVGTLEPRKGHLQLLSAFHDLWKVGCQVNLVIVGKRGWLVDGLISSILSNEFYNKKLYWLESITDEYLNMLYETCDCLIVPSEGEGFGLPIIEAAQKNMPIICRDIPVFREVSGDGAYYFENTKNSDDIKKAVIDWLELFKVAKHPTSDKVNWITWEMSTEQLLSKLKLFVDK